MYRYLMFFIMTISASAMAQKTDTLFLKQLLEAHLEYFSGILHHPTQNEVQVLYILIDRDVNNLPHFTSYSYRLNANHYFYPASTVKLPTLIFALEKANELNIKGLKTATMHTDSAFALQTRVIKDTSSQSGLPSIENYIKKILLVSDNDAYKSLI